MEHVTAYNPLATRYIDQLQAAGLTPDQALAQLDRTLTTQAYLLSTDAVLCISGMLMISLIALIWWAKPPFTVRAVAD